MGPGVKPGSGFVRYRDDPQTRINLHEGILAEQYSFLPTPLGRAWISLLLSDYKPRLKRASGLVALTNDQVRLSAKNPLRNDALQEADCAGLRLRHIGNRNQNRDRTVTKIRSETRASVAL